MCLGGFGLKVIAEHGDADGGVSGTKGPLAGVGGLRLWGLIFPEIDEAVLCGGRCNGFLSLRCGDGLNSTDDSVVCAEACEFDVVDEDHGGLGETQGEGLVDVLLDEVEGCAGGHEGDEGFLVEVHAFELLVELVVGE